MRTKYFLYNSVSFAVLQVIILLTGFVLPRLYITNYGSEINGLISSIVQFISYFSYVEAGLGTSLIYALFKPLAEKDAGGINGIVSLARKAYIKTSKLHFLLVVCLSVIYPFIVNRETTDIATIILLVIIMGISGTLDFYTMAKYRVLLTADQKEYIISMVSTVALIISFVLMVSLIEIKAPIVIVRTATVTSIAIRSLLFYFYVRYKYPFINYNHPSDAVCLKRRYDALISQLSANLYLPVPVIVISIFCSLKTVSVYSVYNLVFAGLIAIISIFTAGVSASFGDVIAKKEFEVLRKVHAQFEYSIFGITAVLYSCAIILINPFISIYTKGITDINYVNPAYGLLFVVWGILHNVRIPYTALENAAGLYRETRKVNIVQLVLLTVLSVILVQFYDIAGVLFALIVAAFYRGIGLILTVRPLVIKDSPAKTFRRIIRMFMIVLLSYVPFLYRIQITASNLNEWFMWAVAVVLWCSTVALFINYVADKQVFIDTVLRLKMLVPKSIHINQRA